MVESVTCVPPDSSVNQPESTYPGLTGSAGRTYVDPYFSFMVAWMVPSELKRVFAQYTKVVFASELDPREAEGTTFPQ